MNKTAAIILKANLKRVGIVLGAFLIVQLFWGSLSGALSAILGAFFSYLILRQLVFSQLEILETQSKPLVYQSYFLRMILYAIPIALTLWLKSYLNLFIILVFLFSFQISYLILELTKNLKHYKKRKHLLE